MIRVLLAAGGVAALVLLVGGVATRIGPWYYALRKPFWNPPNWLFGPMWTLIALLAVWSAAEAWIAAPEAHARILWLFGINAICHMAWSPLFFTLERPDWSLAEVPLLWLSVLALIIGLAPLSASAAWLLVPYIAWVSVAAMLNLAIMRLNAPFGLPRTA